MKRIDSSIRPQILDAVRALTISEEMSDGNIFISPLDDEIHIRTGEVGDSAI
jgi:nitrogen regulatory protein PII